MSSPPGPVLVTGANGQLGRRLLARLVGTADPADGDAAPVRAGVRSRRAASQIEALAEASRIELRMLDYTSAASIEDAARGCEAVVHLVGIIKEGAGASYEDAHERTCEALARAAAAAGVRRVVYLSILGSRPDATNACLASKGRAEECLRAGAVPACVLRVPMVLGADDAASRSLRGQARARVLPLVGGGAALEQPIDADDVVTGVLAALQSEPPVAGALELGGPECLSHRDLVLRAARLYGNTPVFLSLPQALVRGAVGVLERVLANPPMTTAMLEVLQHDDRVDPGPACKQLGIELTPLDDTLRRYVGPDAGATGGHP